MRQNSIRSGSLPNTVMMNWDSCRYCNALDGKKNDEGA